MHDHNVRVYSILNKAIVSHPEILPQSSSKFNHSSHSTVNSSPFAKMRIQSFVIAVALLAFGANAFPTSRMSLSPENPREPVLMRVTASTQVARRGDEEWTKVLAEEKRAPSDEEWTKVLEEVKRSDEEWTKVLVEEKRSPSDEEWTKVLAEEKRSPSDEEWTKVLAAEKRSPSDEEWTKVLAETAKV